MTKQTESRSPRKRTPAPAPEQVETTATEQATPASEPSQTETPAADGSPAAAPAKATKPIPTPDEALTLAKASTEPGIAQRYAKVIRVTEQTKDGSPKRVVIQCQDPQTKFEGTTPVSVCQGEREIAVQDLFQVECCAACADRKVRKARRDRAKRKNKAMRQAMKAAKQG